MREQTFEEQFGELRSLLSGEAGQAGFDAVAGVLSSMARQDPARFEAEVLYYARTSLERWYSQRSARSLALGGAVAATLVLEGSAALGVVRALDLSRVKRRERVWRALCELSALPALEHLRLPDRTRAEALREVLEAPATAALSGLTLLEAPAGAVEALGERARPGIRQLWLSTEEVIDAPQAARLIAALPDLAALSLGGAWERGSALLEAATRCSLRELELEEAPRDVAGWRALELLMASPALERVEVGPLALEGPSSPLHEQLYTMRARSLRSLEVTSPPRAHGPPGMMLDRLLRSPLGGELRALSVVGAALEAPQEAAGSEALETLALTLHHGVGGRPERTDLSATLRWLARGRWPALRSLKLELPAHTSPSALRALCAALPALASLDISWSALSWGCWCMLWSTDGLQRLRGLTSLTIWSTALDALCDDEGGEIAADKAALVDEIAACVEAMPGLKSFWYGALWHEAAQLAGTRAGALLGLEEA